MSSEQPRVPAFGDLDPQTSKSCCAAEQRGDAVKPPISWFLCFVVVVCTKPENSKQNIGTTLTSTEKHSGFFPARPLGASQHISAGFE